MADNANQAKLTDCLHPGHFWFQVSATGVGDSLFLQLVSLDLGFRVLVKVQSLLEVINI